ncbi:hypothetical protein ACWGH3_39400 [Streptomyces sp. NPDC054884]
MQGPVPRPPYPTPRTARAAISYATAGGDGLTKLKPALEEAKRSVPTYAAEEARAEVFGARSLNDFKTEHQYIRDADEKNHFYALDLAGQEGIHNSHVIDKHVGKSDEQLAQRLRDQQILRDGTVRPLAASSSPTWPLRSGIRRK